jgi:hypothetical protein
MRGSAITGLRVLATTGDSALFVVIVSTSMTDKAINSSNVPMATQQLCNAAKAQLMQT